MRVQGVRGPTASSLAAAKHVHKPATTEKELLFPIDELPEPPVEPAQFSGLRMYALFGLSLAIGATVGAAAGLYGGPAGAGLGAVLGLAVGPLTSTMIDHARGHGDIVNPFWSVSMATTVLGAGAGALTSGMGPAILMGIFGLYSGISAVIPLGMKIDDREYEQRKEFEVEQKAYLEQLARVEAQKSKRATAEVSEELEIAIDEDAVQVGDVWLSRD